MDVLVTDGMMKKSLAVVRSIAPVSRRTGVVAAHRPSMAGISRYADRQHRVGRRGPETFVLALNVVIERFDYDCLLPVGGWTTNALAEHRADLSDRVDVVLPDGESMRVAQQKLATYALGKRLGVPVPETLQLTPSTTEEQVDRVGFPAVVKAPTEVAPRYVEYVESGAGARAAADDYRRRHGRDPLLQARLHGDGCGFFALYLDGGCVGGYSHRRVREYPPSGGVSACAVSRVDEQLADLGTTLLDDLEWNGPVMVEFKRDRDETPKLIEINPKLWGSLDLGIASGCDFPAALLRYLDTGEHPEFSFSTQRYHWPLSGDIQSAFHRPQLAPDVVRDLLSAETSSNLSATDPLPNALELAKAVLSPIVDA
ncbi:ATP-grasp domain-containing protein [Halorubrum sp. AD140]|uniref:carboxylate--amine ligase n=1 Tax=Halorubrum sp. AD140 TaxID=3050073 RepID=UPI002ACC55AF|nr:ATP-grasp domain-containing protein [Halorubrum sp. AD140]MDZ5810209.1 ATP-grasp domain-containing protein [Halorubrum sp. AD140]